jgi:LmbE family N-acetylglucosaminyl deacetylase
MNSINYENDKKVKTVAVIVAHPDDETLWAGGTILSNPYWKWFIVCLCRKSDDERSYRFYEALKILKSDGNMGDLNDGPDQKPLEEKEVEEAILDLLPPKHFDLIITHNPTGEYTKHIRHEEISKAVILLWNSGKILTNELWTFAYEDGKKQYYPKYIENASIIQILTNRIWLNKYNLITETFGFEKKSWEAETTPKEEAFWRFTNSLEAVKWLNKGGILT